MIIFITEKPSVATEYKKVLGLQTKGKTDGYFEGYSPVMKDDVQITWAVGHLISIASVDEQLDGKIYSNAELTKNKRKWKDIPLPIIPEEWLYKVNSATYKQFQTVKKLYTDKGVTAIYYAGDSGREGIYIQALIRNQIFKNKDPKGITEKVVWIDSYTEESILNGIKTAKPYHDYDDMIESGYQRAKSDYLIGMNMTVGFTRTSGGLVKVGRVMTPTLAMCVDRQDEIDNFQVSDYYGINADTTLPFGIKWKADKDSKYFESDLLFNENGFSKKEDAEKLLSEFNADKSLTVKEVKETEKKEFAPLLFNLADLQAYCSKTFKISPAKTLEIAQSLYEKKLTTYPRTDARVVSTAVAEDYKRKHGRTIPTKYVDDSKITDHYAIIPTFLKGSVSGLEEKVYEAICNRFEAIFHKPYTYTTTSVVFEHKNGERLYGSFKTVSEIGYKEVWGYKETESVSCDIKKGDKTSVKEFILNKMQTTPPSAYTTGSMILAMEKSGKLIEDEELREQIKTCGIGTSATRAGIIEKLEEAGYITIDKSQKIAPTELGKQIIPIICKFDSQLISPEKTAEMEQKLSDISSGKMSSNDYTDYVLEYIKSTVSNIMGNNTEKITPVSRDKDNKPVMSKTYYCPKCGGVIKYGKFGFYCEKKCGFSLGEVCGHKFNEKDLNDLITKGQTKTYKMKGKKPFNGGLKWENDKTVLYFK